jgi:dephospho-CoA kinase
MHKNVLQNEHFIIGLTGNIGTGKSLIRKMLQHLGAFGIDADALIQDILNSNPSAISKIIQKFGTGVVNASGKLDRGKIAQIVFNDKTSLLELEQILHPLVSKDTAKLIRNAHLPIIVIEAIKLLDSDLVDMCDTIWVVDAHESAIFDRLASIRGMDHKQITERITNQSSPVEMKSRANVVITNDKDIISTWQSVLSAWKNLEKTNSSFMKNIHKKNDLTSMLKKSLVLPESESLLKIKGYFVQDLKPEQPLIWLERKGRHFPESLRDQQILNEMAVQDFVFTFQDLNECESIVICDLTQFDLTICGIFLPIPTIFEQIFPSIIKKVENFGWLQMTHHINIPLKHLIKERTAFFRKLGYNLLPDGDKKFQLQDIAGYNLYQKNMNDNIDIFSN